MKRLLDIRYGLCCVCFFTLLFSCREQMPAEGEWEPETFTLNYILPDTEVGGGLVPGNEVNAGAERTTRSGVTPIARPVESKISSVTLLFFEQDDYGNGLFCGRIDGTAQGDHLANAGSVTFTMGGGIDNDTDYNVLAIANADAYFSSADYLQTYCQGKTENEVRLQLTGTMPHDAKKRYSIPEPGLPMSGIAVKEAGKDLTVNLLRAAVRIDVRVADAKKDEIILTGATLRNASARVPVFNDPKDRDAVMLAYQPVVSSEENAIIGGLYLTETFRTGFAGDAPLRSRQASCLLVSCHNKDYTGTRTWYRADININDEGTQYLRRNNAYTVEISRIKSLGAETPDEAYQSDATLIKAVTIPTEWNTPEGVVTPPEVDIQ